VSAPENVTSLVHGSDGRTSNVLTEVTSAVPIAEMDAAMSSAHAVVEAEIFSHRYFAVPMETRGVVAAWSPRRNELDVTCSCQKAHQAREMFARLLDIPVANVRVCAADVGGGFGQKSFLFREECAIALAARISGRAVKWIEDRWENLVSAAHARNELGRVRLAFDEDLAITAMTVDHIADLGAYPPAHIAVGLPQLFAGPYKTPSLAFTSKRVWTNTMGRGAYRGPWVFETTAREMAIDHAARVLGVDPIELRRRNLLASSDLPFASPGGFTFTDITPLETLERAVDLMDVDAFRIEQAEARAQGRLLGLGCCAYVEPTGGSGPSQATEGALVRIDTDGRVLAYMGTTSQGQSVETTMAQVVADSLGVDYDDVTIIQGQTATTPYGRGTGGSGTAVIAAGAACQAATEVREKVLAMAAHLLEADPADLTIEHGEVFVRGSPAVSTSVREVAVTAYRRTPTIPHDMDTSLEATVRYRPASAPTWSNATHLCVVEIDPDTCMPEVIRYVVVEDCGPMINPRIVDGQVRGGVVQGIGGVLLENFVYDDGGNPLTATLADYLLPTTTEVPEIEIEHLANPAASNAYGLKGVGEGGAIGAHAAVANAVADALSHLGVHVLRTPLGPNDIHALLVDAGVA
jgi:carbon-monoxide dehydrogenase large subunit